MDICDVPHRNKISREHIWMMCASVFLWCDGDVSRCNAKIERQNI